jgi:glycosyltransferase involved in cell wall biosynthesis
MKKDILISILVLTCNHKKYIFQCLDSILNQLCKYPFNVIVAQDCSDDGTDEVILGYQHKFSDQIRVISGKSLLGALSNEQRGLKACQSKYIAFCEGDDFWQDEYKLQKQVDFLENHPDYGLVHSDVDHLYQNSGKLIKNFNKTMGYKIPEGDIFDDIIDSSRNHGHIIKTMSVMVRKGLLDKYYDPQVAIDSNWKLTDLAVWLDIAANSKIHYMDESMATYRLLEESASRTRDPQKKLEFHNSVYDIRKYYMEKYNCSHALKDKLEINHFRTLLADAYFANEKELAEEAYSYLKGHHVKLSWKERLLYLGSKSSFVRRLVDVGRKVFL